MKTIDAGLLYHCVRSGLAKVISMESSELLTPQKLHAKRSRNFVTFVADSLSEEIGNDNIKIFSKYRNCNEKEFRLNELLFDIHACECADIRLPNNSQIKIIKSSLIQIESELQTGSSEMRGIDYFEQSKDFCKLVAGNALMKAFIGGFNGKNFQHVLSTFEKIASNCTGTVCLFLIPHPRNWDTVKVLDNIQTFILKGNKFISY